MRRVPLFALAALLAGAADTTYFHENEKWRTEYESALKAPSGWLSVAGLFWLHEADNSVGADPQSDIVLPEDAPKRAGVLRFQNAKVTFESSGSSPVLVNGKPVSKAELRSNAAGAPDALQIGRVSLTIIHRGSKTGVRLRDPEAAARRDFTGCKWFPVDETYRISAKWVGYAQPKNIAITNILGMTEQEPSPGYAEFTIHGRTLRLEPVTEGDQLFFMFKDQTSGKTTYGAGRFLYASQPHNEEVVLDFNQAHNPPCAFTAFATCPLPPKQNHLPVAIEAGEKRYGKH